MNWSDERYVRVYTRDTADLMAIGWEGRLVWYELLRKLDRAGLLDTGGDVAGLPELLRVPVEVFERGFPRLAARGMVRVLEKQVFAPNFHDAQEAKQSDRSRQRESRLTRLELARAQGLGDAAAKAAARPDYYTVTNRDQSSQPVTNGHDRSHAAAIGDQAAVSGHSVPCLAVPSRTVPDPEETLVGLAPAELVADGSTSPIAEATKPAVSPQDLERIYQAYPRKDGKAAGMRKAKTQIRSQDRLCQLERAVENYTRKVELEATSPQYVKHFSTFMNCWEDYLDPSVAQPVRYMDPSNMKAGDSLRLAAAAEERERDDRFGVPAKLRLSSGGLPDGEDQPGDHGRLPAEAHPLRARRTDGRAEPAHGQGNLLADNRAGPRRA